MRYLLKSIFRTTSIAVKMLGMFSFCFLAVAILAFTRTTKQRQSFKQENFLIFLVLLFEYVLSKVKRSITVNVSGNIDLFCLKVLF